MKPSFKVWWLIIVACVGFNFSRLNTGVVLGGYALAEYIEQRQAKKAREQVLEDVMHGWEQRKNDAETEEKGNFTRVRLVGQNQIIVARIAELISRMP